MSNFRFSLQKVLEIRRDDELQSAKELAEARQSATQARHAVEELEELRNEGAARLNAAHSNGGRVGHFRNLAFVLESLDVKVGRAAAASVEAEAEVETRLGSYRDAIVRRTSLDQLRERRETEWSAKQADAERKQLDEVALTRHYQSTSRENGSER